MSNVPVKGIWIPMEIHCCPVLSAKEKEIIAHICNLSTVYRTDGGCTLSNNQLAYQHQVGHVAVSTAITKANKLGWITSRKDETIKTNDGGFKTIRTISIVPTPEWTVFAELWSAVYFSHETDAMPIIKKLESILGDDKNGADWHKNSVELAVDIVQKGEVSLNPDSINRMGGVSNLTDPPTVETCPLDSIEELLERSSVEDKSSHEKSEQKIIRRIRTAQPVPTEQPKQETAKTDKWVEYWNSLPGVRKHKNPNSDKYRNTAKMIRVFANGKLFSNKVLDKAWLKEKKIAKHLLTRKLNDTQLKEVLKELSKMFVVGYWPDEKGWVQSAGLAGLLYNKWSHNSWALVVQTRPAATLKETQPNKPQENEDAYFVAAVEELEQTLENEEFEENDRKQVARCVDMLDKWWETWDGKTQRLAERFGFIGLCRYFGEWVGGRAARWGELKLSFIKPGGKLWDEFCLYVEDDVLGGVEVATGDPK